MRVAHIAQYDIRGGASRGSYGLHQALIKQGVESFVVVAQKFTDDPTVHGPVLGAGISLRDASRLGSTYIHRELEDALRRAAGYHNSGTFSSNIIGSDIARRATKLAPDVFHLHWVGGGLLRPAQIARLRRPIVWTLRDMWGFTGGCHYAGDCRKFTNRCGACPVLGSSRRRDLSRFNQWTKVRAWSELNLRVVALSRWLAEHAKTSAIFRGADIRVIPPSVDVDVFRPQPQALAREMFGISEDVRAVAFLAQDAISEPRKGLDLLWRAVAAVRRDAPSRDILVLTAGARLTHGDSEERPVPVKHLGMLEDDRMLSLVYAASDVIAVPSTQEAFGKVAIEGMSCGRPVVAFDGTGVADAVDSGVTGLLVRTPSAGDFAQALGLLLNREELATRMGFNARRHAERMFSPSRQAQQYISLYDEILVEEQ